MLHSQLKVHHTDLSVHLCEVASGIKDATEQKIAIDLTKWRSAAHRCCFLPVDYNWSPSQECSDIMDAAITMARLMLALKAHGFRDPRAMLLIGRVRHVHSVLRASLIVHGCKRAPLPERHLAEMIAVPLAEAHELAANVLAKLVQRPPRWKVLQD